MKKNNFLIILFLLFVSILFVSSVKALDDGEIESVSCKSMTGGVKNNLHNTTLNKLNINVDAVTFESVGDYLTCEVTIKNNTDEKLSVDLESISNKSDDYITYSLTTDGENKIDENGSKKYTLDIEYIKNYDSDKTIDNNITIELSGIDNPTTGGSNFIIMISVLLIGAVLLIIYGKKKGKPIFMLGMIFIFITVVYALTKVTINLDNKIIIDNKYAVYYSYYNYIPVDKVESERDNYYKLETAYDECMNWYSENNTDNYSDSEIKEICTEELSDSKETINGKDYYQVYVTSKENSYKAGDTVTMVDYEVTDDNGNTVNLIDSNIYYNWEYSTSDSSELKNMEFSYYNHAYYEIEDEYYIRVRLPSSFIMPKHDVTFVFLDCQDSMMPANDDIISIS